MNWSNVKLIFTRELRDQLRDRRTLFTVLVLPLILYPLMGMALVQVSQFKREHRTTIWLVGAENLPDEPALIVDGRINPLFVSEKDFDLIQLELSQQADDAFLSLIDKFQDQASPNPFGDHFLDNVLQDQLKQRGVDLAVVIPRKIHTHQKPEAHGSTNEPKIFIFRNSASDKSNIAAQRINQLLGNWQQQISLHILKENNLSPTSIQLFAVSNADVADKGRKQAATWSKILPFIVMIWSLTGAFYPAVDLCAGEKERGTLETLLSSPAARNDIAIGKLLTVMTFSILTSVLNLISMGFTGTFVVSRLGAGLGSASPIAGAIGAPPIASIGWLLLALIPISALFSAVALAAASFARSSKEGQYYLMPLMMICMPLMMLPMMPAAKLDFGTSLIPVSGLMLMLRGLIEGQYSVVNFAGPVCAVTLICCWLAVRWVVVQFNSESVLFRPSERFGVSVWLKQVMRERRDLPLARHALLCAVMILVVKFFVGLGVAVPETWTQFTKQTVIVLIATVGIPAILMAMFLTRRPAQSLRLAPCSIPAGCAAVLAAICLHPVVMWLTSVVVSIYPPTGDMDLVQQVMSAIFADAPSVWAILLVIAFVPAVIEEIAFRGFILSGMQSLGSNFKAVVITSILFGVAHSILQQSIVTFFVGLVIGFIAVRTTSLIPCILYHAVHNGLSVLISIVQASTIARYPLLGAFLESRDGVAYEYNIGTVLILSVVGLLLLLWFWKNGSMKKPERDPAQESRSTRAQSFRTFVNNITVK